VLLWAPKIDYLHTTILTATLWRVIGCDGSARAITNRLHTLRGDVEALDEVVFYTLDTLFRERLILAWRAQTIRMAFKLDTIIDILWPA
jgi:hypothetical protein